MANIKDQVTISGAQLISQLNIKGAAYELQDTASRQAIDVLNGDAETNGSVAKSIATALATHDGGKTQLATENAQSLGDSKLITQLSIGSDGVFNATTVDLTTSLVKRTATAAVTTGTKQIALSGTTTEAALVEIAQAIATEIDARTSGDSALLGASTDTKEANTIYGAKAYAKDLVDTLVGEDIESAQKTWETIKAITTEIKDNAAAGGIADTILDKLITLTQGLGTVTPEGGTARDKTVKEYVDEQVANASGNATAAIQALDATVGSTTVDTGKHVAVQVVETDGVLTGLTVTESNFDYEHIAGADSKTLKQTLEDEIATVNTSIDGLDSRLDALEGDNTTIGSVAKAVKDGIEALDAEVTSTDGTNVQVKVTEVDGKITAVNVTDNTINATDLSTAIGTLGNKSENTPYADVKDYVDTQIANSSTGLAVSADGDAYVAAAVDSNNNKKINVSATQKTQDAIAAAETSVQSLTVNGKAASVTGNANAKAATVTINGGDINVDDTVQTKETVKAAIARIDGAIAGLDSTYATDTDVDSKIAAAKSELKGTKAAGDTTDETISGAKNYADTKAAAAKTTVSTPANSGISVTPTTDASDSHVNYSIELSVSYANGVLTIA